jgi:hypothetical protein
MLSSRFVPSTKGMTIKMKISNTTLKFLEKSGWNSCGNIDITIYQEALEAEGYKLSNIAKEFLKQFGGIEILHPAFRVPNAFDKTHFDPIKAIRAIYRGNVEEYEERVGVASSLRSQRPPGVVNKMWINKKVKRGNRDEQRLPLSVQRHRIQWQIWIKY